MHRHTLNVRTKAKLEHLSISLFTSQIHTCFKTCHSALSCEGFARIQKLIEQLPGLCCPKFDIAFLASRLRARTAVTNRKPAQFLVMAEKNGLASP